MAVGRIDGLKQMRSRVDTIFPNIAWKTWLFGTAFSFLYIQIVYILPLFGLVEPMIIPGRIIFECVLCLLSLTFGAMVAYQGFRGQIPSPQIEHELLILHHGNKISAISCLELVTVSGSVITSEEGIAQYNTAMLLAIRGGANSSVSFAYEAGVKDGDVFLRIFITTTAGTSTEASEIIQREATRIEAVLLSSLTNIEIEKLTGASLLSASNSMLLKTDHDVESTKIEDQKLILVRGIPKSRPSLESSQIGTFISTLLKQSFSVSFTCVFSPTKGNREQRKMEREWQSIRSKEKRMEDSLSDQASKKKLLTEYERIQGSGGWFKVSVYILIKDSNQSNIPVINEAVKAIVLSIWDDDSSLSFKELGLNSSRIFEFTCRRHIKSQKMHVSRLVSYVNTPVQRLPVISALEIPKFVVPSSDLLDNEIDIGWTVFEGKKLNRVGLKSNWFREHVAVIGATGTGKTTLVKRMILELSSKSNVPWWIFDVKGSEYSEIERIGEVVVLRPGLDRSFVINLLDNSVSTSGQIHGTFALLRELINESSSSEMSPAMEKLLRQSVYELANQDDDCSVQKLIAIIHQITEKDQNMTMTRDGLLNRLEVLVREPLGTVLSGGDDAIRIADLLDRRVVFDLRHVSRIGGMDSVRLLYNLVAKRIFEAAMRRGIKSGLHHVVVLEEANNLVPESYSRSSAAEITTGESMVMLQRATGQGVIIVSTRPNISSNILANTSTKFTFRLPYDSSIGGRYLSLNETQEKYLRTLKRGHALTIVPMSEAFEVVTDVFDINDYIPINKEGEHVRPDSGVIEKTPSEKDENEDKSSKEKPVFFHRLGELTNHIVAYLASREITTHENLYKYLSTLDSRMREEDMSEIIRDLVSLSTVQREAIPLSSGGFVYSLPGKGLEAVKKVIIDFILEHVQDKNPETQVEVCEEKVDILVDDYAFLVIPQHLKASTMKEVVDDIRDKMNSLGNAVNGLTIVVRGSVAAAKLRELFDIHEEFNEVDVVSAFPNSLIKIIDRYIGKQTKQKKLQGVITDFSESKDDIDLIGAVHSVGPVTSREVQLKLWFGLIQDFVDISKGIVAWNSLLEFIETTASQSLKGRAAPMKAEEGRRALTELLADEVLVAIRNGSDGELGELDSGLWVVNTTVLGKLKNNVIDKLERKLLNREKAVYKDHEYYDLCSGSTSYVVFPNQQQLSTLLRLHSDVACRKCGSTEVICLLTAAEYVDDSVTTPSNLTVFTLDDGLVATVV